MDRFSKLVMSEFKTSSLPKSVLTLGCSEGWPLLRRKGLVVFFWNHLFLLSPVHPAWLLCPSQHGMIFSAELRSCWHLLAVHLRCGVLVADGTHLWERSATSDSPAVEVKGTHSTSSTLSNHPPSSSMLMAGCEHGTDPSSHTDCKWNYPFVIGDHLCWFPLAITLSFAVISRQSVWPMRDFCLEVHFTNSSHFYHCLFPLPFICPLGLAQLKINICSQLCLYGNSYMGWMVEQARSR